MTEQTISLPCVQELASPGHEGQWNLWNGLFSCGHPISPNNRSTHSQFHVRANKDGSAQLSRSREHSRCQPTCLSLRASSFCSLLTPEEEKQGRREEKRQTHCTGVIRSVTQLLAVKYGEWKYKRLGISLPGMFSLSCPSFHFSHSFLFSSFL